MTIKDTKQKEACDIYLEYRKNNLTNPNCCIISATGSGKSKITMLILEEIYKEYDKIYVVVNADRLRDVTWKEDFKKWKKHHILEKVELVNYQSIYKWTKDLSNCFIVYDEVDFAIGTDMYSKVFSTYKNVHSLGLTGYCAKTKRDELQNTLPVILEYTFDQAVADGVINDVKFVFVKFDLSKDRFDIEVKYTKNKQEKVFYQSENDAYDYADNQFRIAYGKYEEAQAELVMGMITDKQFKAVEFEMKRKRENRLKLLYNGIASQEVVKRLQAEILASSTNKVITFSKLTKQCDRLNKRTYHSNNTKEINDENIDMFNRGVCRSLGVCSKIDRGENLVGLNNIILESYTSSDTVITQRRGQFGLKQVNSVKPKSLMIW